MWKKLRIAVLLLALAVVAGEAWHAQQRATTWRATLYVGIFPIAVDGSPVSREYVGQLTREQLLPIERFFAAEARRYGVQLLAPIRIELFPRVETPPPAPPADAGPIGVIWWSLRLRYYAARTGRGPDGIAPHIRIFVLFHDPARSPRVPHSLGLRKGQIGVVHAFATPSMTGSNSVVIAHEFLHTLGATDKYDPQTNAPLYPQGYGDPEQMPRYPQEFAEIMGGRRALSETEQEVPESLEQCVVGRATAAEIGWISR
jgi:hypothetical protein